MVITHEQWVVAVSLGLDSLEQIFVQFLWIWEQWIIIFELTLNYQSLFIINKGIKLFYIFILKNIFEQEFQSWFDQNLHK
jgi:hypothetical protein